MIIIRVFNGIRDHFQVRLVEWALSVIIINIGIRFLLADEVFHLFPSFTNMGSHMTEFSWGIFCVLVGFSRLAALAINGTFSTTIYSKYSPYVRGITAGFSAFVWCQIVLSMIGASVGSPGLAVYPVFIALEIYCVSHALNEAGKTKKDS
jgi:hypothetical protein